PGAATAPSSSACRPMSSSRTRPWSRSPCRSRAAWTSWPSSPASAQASWTATARRCWRFWTPWREALTQEAVDGLLELTRSVDHDHVLGALDPLEGRRAGQGAVAVAEQAVDVAARAVGVGAPAIDDRDRRLDQRQARAQIHRHHLIQALSQDAPVAALPAQAVEQAVGRAAQLQPH